MPTTTATLTLNASFSEAITTGLPQPLYASEAISQTDTYASGTGSGQIDTPYAAQLTLAASTPQTLNLNTGLKDPAGNALAFARVRELVIQNPATTAGYDVKVSSATSSGVAWLPPSANALTCRYGSVLRISDRNSTGSNNGNVVSLSANGITLDPGANTVTLNIIVLGCSSQ